MKKLIWTTIIAFIVTYVFCVSFGGNSKETVYQDYHEKLNNYILQNRQVIYTNIHHPFGSCISAQIKDLNIEWDGDFPECISYNIELFWNTWVTPNGYTKIAVRDTYNYNTKKYETARLEVVETNGTLSGDFWWDLGYNIGWYGGLLFL